MSESEYEIHGVSTGGGDYIEPIRLPAEVQCATEGCSHVAERYSRQCRECREDSIRHELRQNPEPKPLMHFVAFILLSATSLVAQAADYPIVYVRTPITVNQKPRINDIEKPAWSEPGSKLMLLPANGVEEVLYDPGALGGVLDPAVSLDAQWVYFSAQADARHLTNVGVGSPSNIYKINVANRQVVQLTFSEVTRISDDPFGNQFPHNLGACPIPGGRVIFESSRNLQQSVRDGSTRFFFEPHLQLFVMDEDGKNIEQVGYLNLGGSRHPTLLRDGRIMWSSGEFHALRSHKIWGLWVSEPDGRGWAPLWSGMMPGATLTSFHWQSQAPNGNIQMLHYYPLQQQGFGNLYDFPQPSVFGELDASLNPAIKDQRYQSGLKWYLQPVGARSLTPWSTGIDAGGPKVSHPSPAPDGLLVTYGNTATDATGLGGTMMLRQSGIYRIPYVDAFPTPVQTAKQPIVTNSPSDLVALIDRPDSFETQPRALVPWEQIYGQPPVEKPWIPNPTSTPFGFVGTSGVYARESNHTPGGIDPTGTSWGQGGDVGTFVNSEIDKIRIVVQRPTPKNALEIYPAQSKTWVTTKLERMAVLGEITVHKWDSQGNLIKDSTGDPDTSFLAKIPADHSFTFQLLDKHGQVLSHAMTWHQVRPGETRTDCRGCHAHHNPGIQFEGTEASKPGFQFTDLTTVKPKTAEWVRDVLPIFTAKCGECHGATTPAAGLNLLDPNVRDSKWIKPFLARISPVMQRILSEDVTVRMPKDHDPLTPSEIRTIATWIDLGAARNMGRYYTDNQRPVLYVGSPLKTQSELNKIQFGAFEADGTIASISVKASFSVAGRAANAELYDLFPAPSASVWTLPITERPTSGTVTVIVTDDSNRSAKIERTFTTSGGLTPEEIAAIQAQIAALNAQIATLQAEIASLNAQAAAKQAQVVSLQAQVAALEAQLP